LDTNVISELRKPVGRRNPGVSAWADGIDPADALISVITISELATWVARVERRDPASGALLRGWLIDSVLAPGRILPVDAEVGMVAGELHVPDPRDYRDAFIAATALVHSLTVITRNIADFQPTGVAVVNPFR